MGTVKKIILIIVGFVVAGLLVLALIPSPLSVSVARVEKGYFAEYTEDEGFTALRRTRIVSAPISGYLHRVTLEPGDYVQAGDPLFGMEPMPAPGLDLRALKQSRETLQAAAARLRAAEADYDGAAHREKIAMKELERNVVLYASDIISRATMDRVQSDLDQAVSARRSAGAVAQAARYDVENARAVLEVAMGALDGEEQILVVRSRENGLILRRERYQEGVINAGEIILETGNLDELEVQVDLLSVEAVRVRPGMRVILERWGEKRELSGRVRLVEPAGFKRVSALGVDEQRVPVFVEITSPRDEWEYLGHEYRVEARFVLWEGDQVIYVPTSSLFRQNEQWHVFVVDQGRAVLRPVERGRRSGLLTQILKGLNPGEKVITHPGDEVKDGVRVDADPGD